MYQWKNKEQPRGQLKPKHCVLLSTLLTLTLMTSTSTTSFIFFQSPLNLSHPVPWSYSRLYIIYDHHLYFLILFSLSTTLTRCFSFPHHLPLKEKCIPWWNSDCLLYPVYSRICLKKPLMWPIMLLILLNRRVWDLMYPLSMLPHLCPISKEGGGRKRMKNADKVTTATMLPIPLLQKLKSLKFR